MTDEEIAAILNDPKPISTRQLNRLKTPKPKKLNRNLTAGVDVIGQSGKSYRLSSRLSPTFPTVFSIILMLKYNGKWLNLIRHNGFHGAHPNRLEGTWIPANTFHIHRITERYMRFKVKSPEAFAEATDQFTTFAGAVDYMAIRYGVYVHDDLYGGGLFRDLE